MKDKKQESRNLVEMKNFLDYNKKINKEDNTFQKLMVIYKMAIKELNTKVEIIKEEYKLFYNYDLIDHINFRIKEPDSIIKKMSIRERLSGNEAAATAMKQINPDVVAAFPITPSTEIPQYFSTFVANGTVDTEFVAVESEHSAMSACIGAEAAGARAMTATSANGLSLMWEMIYIASSLRLPIVLSLVNRAISGPLNIHNDHSDAMGVRDSGWIMLFSENNQEAYDNTLMAHRIAEHKDVMLPLMVCQDGFITSHSIENIELEEDEKVKKFVGEYHPEHYLLNQKEPIAVGPLDVQSYLF